MQKRKKHKECGSVEVEATVILPIAILSIVLLLYLSLFLFQRASLQACLETCLVYYKNVVTDTFVEKNDVSYSQSGDSYMGEGSTYKKPDQPLSPYRNMFGDGNDLGSGTDFQEYFDSVADGRMLFHDGIQTTIEYKNYVMVKRFEATASQTVEFPLDLSMIGITDGRYVIAAAARVTVVDHDSTIRDLDYAIDLLEDTKVGEMAKDFAGKVKDTYEKIKEKLGGN